MNVKLEILRQNPDIAEAPHRVTYDVEVDQTDRVLDGLIQVTQNVDGSLGFRKSCAHGICGSDAMRINGKERLACRTLFRDVVETDGDVVSLEPLAHLPVQKDLMVDQEPFFEKFRSVKPYLIPKTQPEAGQEFLQSEEERELFDEATKCINCAACYSACPILDKNPDFIGPAAIVQAVRFTRDSRDQGLEARLDELDDPNGLWPCESKFECTRVCPREIKITKLINLTKRQVKKYREERGEEPNDR